MLEVELYQPIKSYFETIGYEVKSEVKNCDVIARKGDEWIAIEMKTRLNLELILQGVDRQRLTPLVYLAVPNSAVKVRLKRTHQLIHLLRRLELGLIIVPDGKKKGPVSVYQHPNTFDSEASRRRSTYKKQTLLKEFEARKGDYNTGGQTRAKIVTAYREESLLIAFYLDTFGPLAIKTLVAKGCGPKTGSILRMNFYGWFERTERGVYGLTQRGVLERTNFSHVALEIDPRNTIVLPEIQREPVKKKRKKSPTSKVPQ